MYNFKVDLLHIYCDIIATVVLANTSIILHNYHFFCVVRTIKIYYSLYNEVSLNCCLLRMRHPGGLCPEVTSFSR